MLFSIEVMLCTYLHQTRLFGKVNAYYPLLITSMVSSNLLVNKYILGVSFQRGAEEEWRPSFGAKIVLLSWTISSCPFDFSWWTFTFDGW